MTLVTPGPLAYTYPHAMNNFKFFGCVGVANAKTSLREEHWQENGFLQNKAQGPVRECRNILLRMPPQEDVKAGKIDSLNYEWLPSARDLPEVCALSLSLAKTLGTERIGAVFVNNLPVGGIIHKHVDMKYWDRYHVVLSALPGVSFHSGDEMVQMLTGEVWLVDNNREHWVENNSVADRIHLVMDFR